MQFSSPRYCKNHPRRVGKRKCFRCGAAICSECQILAHHHFFCGRRCRLLFLGATTSHYLATPFRAVARGTQGAIRGIRLRHLFYAVLLASIAIGAGWGMKMERTVARLQQKLLSNRSESGVNGGSSRKNEHLVISKPAANAMVTLNRITIEGDSEPNRIISLSSGDEVIAVTLPEKGHFRFDQVPAHRGQNRLEVRAIAPDGEVTVLQVLEFVYNNPIVAYLARDFTHGDRNRMKIALTFDGGSVANVTSQILDILTAKGVRCTMFLTGDYIRHFPEEVRRIVADGHEVGNHTWSHPHLTTFEENRTQLTRADVNREFVQDQLRRTAELFRQVTGVQMHPFWRAPYGEHNLEIREWAAELGYRHVGWTKGSDWERTMDTLDWVADPESPAYHSADEIYDKITAAAGQAPQGLNGSVILMHLGSLRNGDFPHTRLSELIDSLRGMGYEFVPVSDLVAY